MTQPVVRVAKRASTGSEYRASESKPGWNPASRGRSSSISSGASRVSRDFEGERRLGREAAKIIEAARSNTATLTKSVADLALRLDRRDAEEAQQTRMPDADLQHELDLREKALEARVDVKFEALRGDIRELKAATAGKATVIVTAIAPFAAIATVVVWAAGLGWQGFGTGLSARDIARTAARDALSEQAASAPAGARNDLKPALGR